MPSVCSMSMAIGALLLAAASSTSAANIDVCTKCTCTQSATTPAYTVDCRSRNPWSNDPTGTVIFPALAAGSGPAAGADKTTILTMASTQLTCLACSSGSNMVDISNLGLLEDLTLSSNGLDEIAAGDFTNVVALTKLDVSKNSINKIHKDAFKFLVALTTLDLSGNALSGLEAGVFDTLVNLVTLTLTNNRLAGLPTPGIFTQNSAMQTLRLDINLLTSDSGNGLTDGAFTGLTGLTHIYLDQNKLTIIRNAILSGLSSIETVSLQGNQLTDVSSATFGNWATLNTVNLQNNLMVSVSSAAATAISAANGATALSAAGTNWDCCTLDWVLQMATSGRVADLASIKCARPEMYQGKDLQTVRDTHGVTNWAAVPECAAGPAPNTPTAPRIVSKTSTSIQLEWSKVTGNAFAVDYYNLEYAVGATPSASAYKVATCPSGRLPPLADAVLTVSSACSVRSSASITYNLDQMGLKMFQDYTFRVRAHTPLPGTAGDGGTWSTTGPTLTVRTSEDTPGKVGEPVVTSPSPTSLQVTWNAPSEPNGVIVKYVVKLTDKNNKATLLEPAPRTGTSLTISNLIAANTYKVAVTAHTAVGSGVESNTAVFSTAEDVPYRPSAGVRASSNSSITAESISLVWDALKPDDRNGIIIGYTVKASVYPPENAGKTTILGLGYARGDLTRRMITQLVPASTYTFSFAAHTSAGISAFSPTTAIGTLDAAPIGQSPPNATTPGPTSLSLLWKPPYLKNGDIVNYLVTVAAVKGAPGSNPNVTDETVRLNVRGDQTQLVVTGLQAATNYEVRLAASTRLAQSNFSKPTTIQTMDSVPSQVVCNAATISATETRITWTEPIPTNGLILEYQVVQVELRRSVALYQPYVENADKVIYRWKLGSYATSNSFSHTGLSPYTRYTYAVQAKTSNGGWSPKTYLSATTTLEDVPTGQSPPTVRVLGANAVQIFWSLPTNPNGEITKFEIHNQQGEGQLPVYSGIPLTAVDQKRTVNITGMSAGTSYEFTITSFTQKGSSLRSTVTVAETKSTKPSASTATLISVICVFVFILSIGFMWEHKVRGSIFSKTSENTVSPGDELKQMSDGTIAPLAPLPPPGQAAYGMFPAGPDRGPGSLADPFSDFDLGLGRARRDSESSSSSGSSYSEGESGVVESTT